MSIMRVQVSKVKLFALLLLYFLYSLIYYWVILSILAGHFVYLRWTFCLAEIDILSVGFRVLEFAIDDIHPVLY